MSGATPAARKPAVSAGKKPAVSTASTSASNSMAATATTARSPSRAAATASPAAAPGRKKSVRASTPASARALRKPAAEPDTVAWEEQRAEMQAKLEELQEKLQQAELATEASGKQVSRLQNKLDDANKELAHVEERAHEQSEKLEELELERKESVRARRELEQIYETERAQAMKQKEEALQREEELQAAMRRLQDSAAQRGLRNAVGEDGGVRPNPNRSSSFRSGAGSPVAEGPAAHFAPAAGLQRSDSRNNSKLLMQKDEIIKELKMDLAEAQLKLTEADNLGGGRLLALQKEMYDIKIQNARLMEENESFQLLLSEKTLSGDIAHLHMLRPPSLSRPSSSQTLDRHANGATLADELDSELDVDGGDDDSNGNEQVRKLQAEVNSLKDQNKALTLYINNIISRLLQSDQFEQILDKTSEMMPGKKTAPNANKELPPPPKDEKAADDKPDNSTGLLQRAKSVMGGRKRPATGQAGGGSTDPWKAEEQAKLTENPDTAPRVMLGRSNSSRNAGHRRANSEMGYRGNSPGSRGPLSPGLSGQGAKNPFFTGPQGRMDPRRTSGTSVAPISETEGPAHEQREGRARHSSAVEPGIMRTSTDRLCMDRDDQLRGQTSPSRSTTSSDRDCRAGGAVMVGSKPRPLRLVQEAAEEERERKAANRGSWFGWMNKAGGPGTAGKGDPSS
ncbi:hypothetical protein K470DRAFT_255562 [Piedraia hortae CBS 480.64]|uniref:M protein, serotype 2.1 n=1 Tax=Piedraia hortae CBS 480.64 TaxID=1314780 RepID=A0A6A7C6D4_9PEZI|nr:hypothetical protein K470DRAFT_255562 [Piedraia hortae CBS 480.64]